MQLHEFSAIEYSPKIAIVKLGLKDVTKQTLGVGIWPWRSGWGLGYVELLCVDELGAALVVDDDILSERCYGLVKIVWEKGAEEREIENWVNTPILPS